MGEIPPRLFPIPTGLIPPIHSILVPFSLTLYLQIDDFLRVYICARFFR